MKSKHSKEFSGRNEIRNKLVDTDIATLTKTNSRMKTLALSFLLIATILPFAEEPQYLRTPKEAVIQVRRK